MSTDAQNLHEGNVRLASCLNQLCGGAGHSAACAHAAGPAEIELLLSELMQAGQLLRNLPEKKEAQLERELALYQSNVTRLRDMLPSIHDRLLRERARLEQERSRVESAAEWVRGSRQTL
ncbi:MAG TPA: hypothetical protein VHW45_03965 [Candidatus Sulfotelmatobacter sp.]|nr:hypothetical protein [Candidatus Sulfotelmatobacter sp.]